MRPGGATAVDRAPGRPCHGHRPDGGQPAELTVLTGADDGAALGVGRAGDGPARLLARRDRLPRLAARGGLGPTRRARSAVRARRSPRASRSRSRAERDARSSVAAPGGPGRGRRPARLRRCVVEMQRAAPRAARGGSSCRRRWPSRGSTSASTRRPRSPTRSAPASTSRSSTSRAPVLGLPRLPRRQARATGMERGLDPHGDPHPDGHRVPAAGPATRKYFDADMDPLVRGGAGHRRAPRHVRARLHRATTRTSATPATSTARRTSTGSCDAVRDRRAQGLGGAELLLQHLVRPATRAPLGRAVVAAGRLRAAAGA